jgi:ABC-type glycerol-3-phosphate transport system permease component
MRKRKPNRGVFGSFLNIFFLSTMALIFILPIIFMISRALMPLDELFLVPPRFIVRNPTLENFRDLANLMANSWVPFVRYIFNTVLITVVGTVGHVFIASLAAYVLAKHHFPGRNVFFSIVILSLMFAPQVTMIPNYLIMSKIRFVDTYLSLIVPAFAFPLGLFLMKQFMEQIPDSLLESAKIDGAGEIRVFLSIAMPSVRPAWLTLIIISVQQLWNLDGRNFIFTEELKTLPLAFQQIALAGIARAGVGSVVVLVMLAVPVVVFVLNQSRMIETMAASGIKE